MICGMSRHQSIWAATAEMPRCEALSGDLQVQVCVVGGGIAGLTTAYLLARAGRSVALLDDGPLAGACEATLQLNLLFL